MYPYLITLYGMGFGKSRPLVWLILLPINAVQLALIACSVWSWLVSCVLRIVTGG